MSDVSSNDTAGLLSSKSYQKIIKENNVMANDCWMENVITLMKQLKLMCSNLDNRLY